MNTHRAQVLGCKVLNGRYCSRYYIKEKDLGVTLSTDMKVSEQCHIAASKGNQIVGLIRRTITYKEKEVIVSMYIIIVIKNI